MTMYSSSDGSQTQLASDVTGFYGSYGMPLSGYGEMVEAERSPYNKADNHAMLGVTSSLGYDVPGVYLSIVHQGYVLISYSLLK